MSKKDETAQNEVVAKRHARLDQVLGTATDEAKRELGDSDNTAVTATATLDVSKKEGATTTSDGVNASVTLGTSHSSKTDEAK
jgi:hypothetical protein